MILGTSRKKSQFYFQKNYTRFLFLSHCHCLMSIIIIVHSSFSFFSRISIQPFPKNPDVCIFISYCKKEYNIEKLFLLILIDRFVFHVVYWPFWLQTNQTIFVRCFPSFQHSLIIKSLQPKPNQMELIWSFFFFSWSLFFCFCFSAKNHLSQLFNCTQ